MRVERLPGNPIIGPGIDARVGSTSTGRRWCEFRSGFVSRWARTTSILRTTGASTSRMAYADDLEGPWATYGPGVLDLAESLFARPGFSSHVASPDVHVDEENRQIRMYYHGVVARGVQRSRVALSEDGISFEARNELLGNSYFRVFQYGGYHYAIAMPGVFYRSRDGLTGFVEGRRCSARTCVTAR